MNKEILEKVIITAKKAGQVALSFYNSDYEIKDKGGDSPLTQADLEANKIILESLSDFGFGILSEEKEDSSERLEKDRAWIIDPLDGTKDFINKTGEFSIMIGLVEKVGKVFEPVLGVVYLPAQDLFYYASKGRGAFKKEGGKNEERIGVSHKDNFSDFKMVGSRFHSSDLEEELFQKLGFKNRVPCGSVGVKVCKIAEGGAELNLNSSDKTWEWDVCAPDAILREAGGIITDLDGNHFSYNKKDPRNLKGYIASNGLAHQRLIKEIKSK